jgi:hypothetical protein
MAEGRLAPAPSTPEEHYVSAPLTGADFLSEEFEASIQESITDPIISPESNVENPDSLGPVFLLRERMDSLLAKYREKYARSHAAADYAGYYRDELEIDDVGLTNEQKSALTVSKVYLSALESLGQLGKFIEVNKWVGRKSQDAEDAKVVYLASRKRFQEDVDDYFKIFSQEPEGILSSTYIALQDTVNLARLTLNRQRFVTAETDDHTHVFLGSVLSERAVMISLKKYVHRDTRYGTEDEDKSPTKADVVFPIKGGDMHVQVKMKWQKDIDMKIQPKKKPPHVVVPMKSIRGDLNPGEHARLAEIISAAAERKVIQFQIEEALALSGLKKYRALFRIPKNQFNDWWAETKEVLKEPQAPEPDDVITLQTGVDKLQLAA